MALLSARWLRAILSLLAAICVAFSVAIPSAQATSPSGFSTYPPDKSTDPLTVWPLSDGPSCETAPALLGTSARQVEQLQTELANAVGSEDRPRLDDLLLEIESTETTARDIQALACLRSEALYQLDRLNGWRYLTAEELPSWQMVSTDGTPIVNPVDFVVTGRTFHLIDGGTLYTGDLPSSASTGGTLTVSPLLDRRALVEGDVIQELMAVAPGQQAGELYALDRAGGLYRRPGPADAWVRFIDRPREQGAVTPLFVDLVSDADGLLLLDVAGNQIWRQNWAGERWSLLATGRSWQGDTLGRAVAVQPHAGGLYALLKNGRILASTPGGRRVLDLNALSAPSSVAGFHSAETWTTALAFDDVQGTLYVADRVNRRIVAVSAAGQTVVANLAAPNDVNFSNLRGLQIADGLLYASAGGRLYRLDPSQPAPEAGYLPVWSPARPAPSIDFATLDPQDPDTLRALESLSLTMPVVGARLPLRPSLYPGARRAYRYGVHRGVDFFTQDSQVTVVVGTPVLAALDGVVMRADHTYEEMTAAQIRELMQEADEQHGLPSTSLDRLGGRQIWIRHAGNLWTIYSHLDSIAENIEIGTEVRAGDVIAAVGVSGTPDGILGDRSTAHLHFEIWMGSWPRAYLGQWLPIVETQRIYESLFAQAESQPEE